jgi:hypothetical protein
MPNASDNFTSVQLAMSQGMVPHRTTVAAEKQKEN